MLVSMEGILVAVFFSLSGYIYLANSGTDWLEILQHGTYRSQRDLIPFGAVPEDPQI